MNVAASSRLTWWWGSLGLAGSLLVAYMAPSAVPDPVVRWWYHPGPHPGRAVSLDLLYLGMAALCVAWLALGRTLPSTGRLVAIAAVWALPLALAPPLFSRDLYSYLAQGAVMHLGHSPYRTAPQLLATAGQGHLLDAVSPFWRRTTAPYGPLFLGLVGVLSGAAGSNLVLGVLLVRLLELTGFGMLALALPRLARAMGTEPRRVVWLVLLSPLVMLELIAGGHNDLLMGGLVAVGVVAALSGQPLIGIAVCALAATIKLPALAAGVFIAVAWMRGEPEPAARLRFALAAVATALAVLAVVTLLTGVGLTWLSTSVFSTPAKVRLAVTPATAVGYTVASLLRDFGVTTTGRGLEGAFGIVATVLTGAAGLWLLARVRVARVVPFAGAFLLIAAAGGPAAWPWYAIWGLALVAALRPVQSSWVVLAAIVVSVFVVKPNGILALPLPTAPVVLAVYAALAAVLWARRRREPAPAGDTSSALAGS